MSETPKSTRARKRVRSKAGRRRGKERYARRKTDNLQATGQVDKEGQPGASYWDFGSDDFSWEDCAEKVINFPHGESPLVDGSGLPTPEMWSPSAYNLDMAADPVVSKRVADCIFDTAANWAGKGEVKRFLGEFGKADRNKQRAYKEKWVELGLQEVADDLAFDLASILSEQGYGQVETLMETASRRSPLRGRLLEVLSKATSPAGASEDSYGAVGVMGGAAVGLLKPMVESPNCWPSFTPKPLRKGEPTDLVEWDGQTDAPTRLRPELLDLTLKKIDEELEAGRMERISLQEANRRDMKVLTPLSSIFKDPSKTKVRMISNYRVSGVNRKVEMSTTTLLPRMREIGRFATECVKCGKGGSGGVPEGLTFPHARILQYDVQNAYRLLDTDPEERKWLAVSDPASTSQQESVLWDNCLPFGLSSACLAFTRYNAAAHRVQRRVVGSRMPKGARGLCYVDDSAWRVFDWVQIIALLLIPLAVGLRLEFSKLVLSDSHVDFLGYAINLDQAEGLAALGVPDEKREIIRESIAKMESSGWVAREDLSKLVGRLNFTTQLLIQHKPWLSALYALSAVMDKENLRKVRLGGQTQVTLRYFYNVLAGPCTIIPRGSSESEWFADTDASLGGIGGFFGNKQSGEVWWFLLKERERPQTWATILRLGQSRDNEEVKSGWICFLEMVALACAVLGIEAVQKQGGAPESILVRCFADNVAAVQMCNRWRSSSKLMQIPLSWIHNWAGRVTGTHIPGVANVVADSLSRQSREFITEHIPRTWKEIDISDALLACVDNGREI